MTTSKFRMLTNQVAASLNATDMRVLQVPHPLGGTDETTILEWADAAVDTTIKLFLGSTPAGAPTPESAVASSADAAELDHDAIQTGLAEVRALVQADGGDIVLESANATTVRLRLVLDSAECRECVMPREFLEQVALNTMRSHVAELSVVSIIDPREPSTA